jgi:beta-glucosidase
VPSAVNHWLLTDVLRGQWGFDGFVTDDLGAVTCSTPTGRASRATAAPTTR